MRPYRVGQFKSLFSRAGHLVRNGCSPRQTNFSPSYLILSPQRVVREDELPRHKQTHHLPLPLNEFSQLAAFFL